MTTQDVDMLNMAGLPPRPTVSRIGWFRLACGMELQHLNRVALARPLDEVDLDQLGAEISAGITLAAQLASVSLGMPR
jgi:hypothetical protein